MGDISVDLCLETLKQLLIASNLDFTMEEQSQLEALEEEIKYLRRFLKIAEKRRNTDSEVMNLVVQIRDVVSKAENAVELFIVLVSKGDHASNSLREHKDHLFLDLERVEKDIKNLEAEVKQNFDMMGNISLQLFLEITWKEFLNEFDYHFIDEKDREFRSFEKAIIDLRGALNVVEKKHNKHSEVIMNLRMHIEDAVSDAEKAVKSFKWSPAASRQLLLDLERVKKDIKNLTFEVTQICNEISLIPISGAAVGSLEHSSTGSRGGSGSLGNPSELVEEKVVVGFEEDVEHLLFPADYYEDPQKWGITFIKGPPGCGKTTLARKVYDHPSISMAFKIRAWVVVPQDYDQTMKRDLLIDIFKSIFPKNPRLYERKTEGGLVTKLEKVLSRKKYLIVMDNLWDIKAWEDIRSSFPWQCDLSSFMITSREPLCWDNYHKMVHFVKPLSKSCSWELLEVKVFGKKRCPSELVEIGKRIVEKCEGLPLAIVTVAGILATEKKILGVWQQIANRVSSILAEKGAGFMELLEPSYNHLPLHLKACFLYIGAHLKDYEISVRELTWLWIAEGFIQQDKSNRSLEAIAKTYLDDLIHRNLVTVARISSILQVKTCHIPSHLREFCLKKAKEENFFAQINGDDSSIPSDINKNRRLFVFRKFFDKFFFSRPYPQNLRSLLCLGSQHSRIELYMSFFVETFKLLRVFSFVADECRGEILRGQLVHLRYLALRLPEGKLFCSQNPFRFLSNLEILNLRASCTDKISLPRDIVKMVKLRHLYSKGGIFECHHVCYDEDKGNMLDSLQTLHRMCICEHCLRFLERTPNLMKLGLIGDPDRKGDNALVLPDLEFLKCLETLYVESVCISSIGLRLPPTLTKLSLKQTNLKWEQLSILLEALPWLEALKLLTGACSGPVWNTTKLKKMSDRLVYLKLDGLDIKEWRASKDQVLWCAALVIRHCKELKGIPIVFVDSFNLHKINVEYSNQFVEKSAKAIREKHLDQWPHKNMRLILRFNAL